MDYQQPPFMRPPQPPPPPSMPDPNHHQPSFVPPPPAPTWFSGQFQYNGHSPSPALPNHNQQHWGPPPGPYSAPPHYPAPPPPYPAHNQYPPPPPPRPALHHSYRPQLNQEWQNPSWSQHQGLDYSAHSNGEDWAAKARAWAAAQTSMEDQYPQSQYTSVGRAEENHHPMINPHYSDGQHFPVAPSSYQQYQPSVAPPYQVSESSLSSGYVPDGQMHFTGRNGSSVGESNAAFPHQESTSSNLSVHRQEVPSSYSSVAGKEDGADQNEQLYKSPWTFTSTSQQQAQPPHAAVGGAAPMEQPHYSFSHQSAEPPTDLSDQPLNFAPRFSQGHDQHLQPNYSDDSGVSFRGMDNPASVPSIHAWSDSAATGVVYPPVHPSGPQADPSLAIPSPIQGHSGPLFGRFSVQNFQSMIPSVSAPFVGGGTFPGDVFSASGVPDRPKKASVPNWLREEIIKKKAVIATSAPELAEDDNSIEMEAINKSSGKGDLADNKSIDSSRSTEEEADEEDEVEIARTAAINQEIKRVLTEVLLKVTDELFDEIANKVLDEDNPTSAVDHNTASSNNEVSPSTSTVPTSKVSTKVLVTTKIGETDTDDNRQSTLSAPGVLLGLASYASDDEDDEDNQNIDMPNSSRNTIHQPSAAKILPEDVSVVKNGRAEEETKENQRNNLVLESHPDRMSPSGGSSSHMPDNELNDKGSRRESIHGSLRSRNSSKTDCLPDDINMGAVVVKDADISMSKNNVEESVVIKTESPAEITGAKKVTTDITEVRETRNKSDNVDRYDKRRSSGKDSVKDAGEDDSHWRQEERKVKKEKSDGRSDSKEKLKEQGLKSAEKSKNTDSKKRSTHRDDKDLRETEKDSRTRGNDKKRDRTRDGKGERSRSKFTSDSSRRKRHRSSSVGSKGQDTKHQAVVSYTNDSSDDESSSDSRRKSRSRKQKLSTSPVKSRRRQVSRSPHSKHSQRRHSPYSSLEITRRKRSRSRSPARRKR